MTNNWKPSNNNLRNNGKAGYVPLSRNYSNTGNIIKFYTRVIKKDGVWQPDKNSNRNYFVRPANGKNFLKVPNLRGLTTFIKVTNLYGGHWPLKTTHKWSNVGNERKRPNRGLPYNFGVGLRPNIN